MIELSLAGAWRLVSFEIEDLWAIAGPGAMIRAGP